MGLLRKGFVSFFFHFEFYPFHVVLKKYMNIKIFNLILYVRESFKYVSKYKTSTVNITLSSVFTMISLSYFKISGYGKISINYYKKFFWHGIKPFSGI